MKGLKRERQGGRGRAAGSWGLEVLAKAAAWKAGEFPLPERIKIYQALAEALPAKNGRGAARELARIYSKAAAMELNFQEGLGGNPI